MLYEGMFILPGKLTDDQLEDAVANIRQEIEKLAGEVKSVTRLGKRPFARPMKKQDSGYYYVIDFEGAGDSVDALTKRFKLNDNVFRVQFVRKVKDDGSVPAAFAEEQAE